MSSESNPRLFHIVTAADWEAAKQSGTYRPASLESEGFIHLSTEAQVSGTLRRHFAGRTDLVLLSLDADRLTAPVRFEDTSGHGEFPHLYGALNLDAVLGAEPVAPPNGL